MNFKKYHVSRNLFDKDDVTFSRWYSANGTLTLSATYGCITAMFPVSANTLTISWSGVQPNSYSFVYFDENGDFVERKHKALTSDDKSYTVTAPDGATQFIVQVSCPTQQVLTQDILNSYKIMLNTGDTALPYEPYSSEVWHDIPHYVHKTSTDTITTLPADLYADGNNATVGLVGNMYQASGVSPTTPIQPQETGERTGNLFVRTGETENAYIRSDGEVRDSNDWNISDYISINSNLTYSFEPNSTSGTAAKHAFYDSNKEFISTITSGEQLGIVPPENAAFMRFSYRDSSTNIMLNSGSTALPYEPYGFKIPISSGNTTTPVYLGEVESTRQIKKLVLDGTEGWFVMTESGTGKKRAGHALADCRPSSAAISSHYQYVSGQAYPNVDYFSINSTSYLLVGINTNIPDAAAFKSYLAAQYANGTPVCVWYVLAEPTTGIVNEPLRKIGDYADTISNVAEIPTTAGEQTFDVDTTLKPSGVEITYKGWHKHIPKEYNNGSWS